MHNTHLQDSRLHKLRGKNRLMTNSKKVQIAIIDDHNLFRKGICTILNEVDEFNVAIETSDPRVFLGSLKEIKIDVAIVDIKMPEMNGFELTEELTKQFPDVKVIALSMFKDDAPIIQMLRAGAKGYLVKGCEPWELKEAIKSVYEKGFYNGDVMSRTLISRVNTKDQFILKDFEIEFLNLCCSEMTYKEIAAEMSLSPRTIDGYRDRLFEKLNVKSRTGLVLYAIRTGICILK